MLHIISVMVEADGHSHYCRRLGEELAAKGHACAVCCAEGDPGQPRSNPQGVPVTRYSGVSKVRPDFRPILRSFRPDLLHIHGLWHPFVHAGAVAARRARLPYLVTLHGMLRPQAMKYGRVRKHVAWQVYQRSDLASASLIHAISQPEQGDPARLGVAVPVCHVGMGVDLPVLAARQATSGLRRVLCLSRLHPAKGIDNLIEAWATAAPAGWELVIAGPDEKGYEATLRAHADRVASQARIVWMGAVYGAAKQELLASSDLLILPSLSENFGIVVGEALAAGIPAIATHGAPWKILEERKCGWWVAPGATSLVCVLRQALTADPVHLRAMGTRGREWVASTQAWSNVAEDMAAGYASACRATRCKGGI